MTGGYRDHAHQCHAQCHAKYETEVTRLLLLLLLLCCCCCCCCLSSAFSIYGTSSILIMFSAWIINTLCFFVYFLYAMSLYIPFHYYISYYAVNLPKFSTCSKFRTIKALSNIEYFTLPCRALPWMTRNAIITDAYGLTELSWHNVAHFVTTSHGDEIDKWHCVCTDLSMMTGSDGVSLRLPQLFFSQHRLSSILIKCNK